MSAVRARRTRRLAIRLAVFTGIPTMLATTYFYFIATPQYESSATISVQSSRRGVFGLSLLSVIMPKMRSGRDTRLAREYLRSRDMLDLLDRRHHFLAHYRRPTIDWWSRLGENANSETRLRYYRDKVRSHFNSKTNTLTVHVRAFSAERARTILRALISYTEDMVNHLSDRSRGDRVKLAETELMRAEKRLAAASALLTQLRTKKGTIDPSASAASQTKIATQLELELVRARTQLATVRTSHREGTPVALAAKHRVVSLEREIAHQQKKLRGASPGDLAPTVASFDAALLEQEFAKRFYGAALRSLELARVEASRQQSYLVTLDTPSLPDVPTYPRRLLSIGAVFLAAFGLMGVMALLGAAAREHAQI